MDVQAAAATAPIQPSAPPPTAPAPAPVSAAPALAAAPLAATSLVPAGAGGSNAAAAPTTTSGAASNPHPGLATLPAGPPDGSKKGSDTDSSLTSGIAQLYNVAQQNVSVSFQVSTNPNEIVTVFTDTKTGKVIVQFPSETMIALAKLFDKLDGSVVNKKV